MAMQMASRRNRQTKQVRTINAELLLVMLAPDADIKLMEQ